MLNKHKKENLTKMSKIDKMDKNVVFIFISISISKLNEIRYGLGWVTKIHYCTYSCRQTNTKLQTNKQIGANKPMYKCTQTNKQTDANKQKTDSGNSTHKKEQTNK